MIEINVGMLIHKILLVITLTLIFGSVFAGLFYFRGMIDCPEDHPCSLPGELTKKYIWYLFGAAFVMSLVATFSTKERDASVEQDAQEKEK